MDFRLAIAQQILAALPEAQLEAADVASMLEVPPDTKLGDYAFPCFKLSKALRKSPVMIADALAGTIQADFLARVESVRGYLNFFIDRAIYAERVLTAAAAQGDGMVPTTAARASAWCWITVPSTSPSASISAICPPR